MRPRLPSASKRYPLSLVKIARLFRTRLPSSELPHYDAYMSCLGRDDFVAATKISEERANPLLWAVATPAQYRIIRQAYSVCEKITCEGDIQATERAWQKFCKCESKCRRTNRKIRYLLLRPYRWKNLSRGSVSYYDVGRIREVIRKILGDFWTFYTEMVQDLAFGPGMSLSSVDAVKTSIPFKLSDEVTVTKSAVPVWRDVIKFGGFLPNWVTFKRTPDHVFRLMERVQIVPGCRITFVPKTSVVKRTIAIEPSANISIQLAVHRYLKKRLRRKAGIDISDQSRNRSLALRGSLNGDLATLDLSSASDLISTEVVKLLLPEEWFVLLDAIRSKEGQYANQTVRFEKFSSMGNGFTFALETLLFFAICKVAGSSGGADYPSVYGDDIIVHTSDYNSTVKWLEAFGFTVNTKKSYAAGPFRESCGLDAFNGVDVRPIYLRAKALKLVEAIAYHNHCYQRGLYDVCEYIVSTVPEHLRLFGPPGPAAGFFFTEEPRVLERFRKRSRDTQSYTYLGFVEVGRKLKYHEKLLLESTLYAGGVFSDGAPLRSVSRLKTVAAHRDH